jgi:hypothetical protein
MCSLVAVRLFVNVEPFKPEIQYVPKLHEAAEIRTRVTDTIVGNADG